MLWLVSVIIVLALAFDFVNGMNDAANSIATVVSARVLTPKQAVAWAAFWNAAAMVLVGTAVAKTISGVVPAAQQDPMLVLAGLVGAVLMTATYWVFNRSTPAKVDRYLRAGQLLSSAAFSLGHDSGDAQKSTGIIVAALVAGEVVARPPAGVAPGVPLWVVVAAHAAIGLGTRMAGWRVIRTMGGKLSRLRPEQGFCAETAGALALTCEVLHLTGIAGLTQR